MYRKYLIVLIISIALLQSCQKSCKDYYYPLDGRLFQFFLKPGTYWVYRDSATGMIDSQYVYAYRFRQYFTYNPSPNRPHSTCQLPVYTDSIYMYIREFQNSLPYRDSIKYYSFNGGLPNIGCTGYNYLGIDSTVGALVFSVDSSVYKNEVFSVSQITISGVLYQNVIKVKLDYINYFRPQILCPTEFYYLAGYGIIRKVEYRSTGTVSWDLMRYQIVR